MSGGSKAALRALIDDLERIETMVRVRSPELGTENSDTHVDVLVFEDSDTDAFVIEQILRRHCPGLFTGNIFADDRSIYCCCTFAFPRRPWSILYALPWFTIGRVF